MKLKKIKIRVQNILSHVFEFLRRNTYVQRFDLDVMKSCRTRVLDKKIRNGYITSETRVVMCKKRRPGKRRAYKHLSEALYPTSHLKITYP